MLTLCMVKTSSTMAHSGRHVHTNFNAKAQLMHLLLTGFSNVAFYMLRVPVVAAHHPSGYGGTGTDNKPG